MFDYLIVGTGLYGAVFAAEAKKKGKSCLAVERRNHIGGNIYTEESHGINIHKYGPHIFHTDSDEELNYIVDYCKKMGVQTSLCEVFAKGGAGGMDLAQKVCDTIEMCNDNEFAPLYSTDLSISKKVEKVAKEIYRADGVKFLPAAAKALQEIERLGAGNLPVCIAKTQYSLSDDPALLGKPEGFTVTVRDVRLSAGAGFVVVLTGDIMTMPGLPKKPAAFNIDCDNEGHITGLF